MTSMRGRHWVATGVIVIVVGVGCGGDATHEEPAPSEPAQYAIIYGDTLRRLSVVSTLSAGGTAELEAAGQGVPLPMSNDLLVPLDHSGTAYVPRSDHTLTEVFIESGPALRVGRAISLASLIAGSSMGMGFLPISPGKAYLLRNDPTEILVWNREEMTTGRQFSLGLDIAEGYEYRAVSGSRVADGELTLITHSAASDGRAAYDLTITRIDIATDQVISHEVDGRCTGLRGATLSNGDLYMATRVEVAARNWPPLGSSVEPCALRLRAGETSLDPSYRVSFGDWVGSRLWGGTLPGARGELLTLVASESAAQSEPRGAALREPIWQLWEVDPELQSARPHGSLPSITAFDYLIPDSRVHLRVPDPIDIDSESTAVPETLIDIAEPSAPVPGIRLPAETVSVFRFR
jgi:hypothetical protein